MNGYVYVYGGQGVYKIGRAKDPQKRVKAFPVMPYPCAFAHIIESEDCVALERQLHDHFKPQRVEGEWYSLAQTDLDSIPQIANPPTPPSAETSTAFAPRFTFRRYLDNLKRIERRKAEGGEPARAIPSMEEIADAVEIHPVSFSRIVNNNVKRLNLDTMGKVIAYMRSRGFSMQTTDFLDFDDLNRVNN